MGIQIRQEFPHCERCGKMIHTRQLRLVAAADGRQVVFCSELCRDEYEQLFGLSDGGKWVQAQPADRRSA